MAATYLTVPFREKDEAKSLGARWDAARKRWYVPDGVALAGFERWLTEAAPAAATATSPAGGATAPVARGREPPSLPVAGLDAAPLVVPAAPGSLTARDPGASEAVPYGQPRAIPLARLLDAVAEVVSTTFSAAVWTTAEVLRVSGSAQGHVYLELSERDAQGRVTAKANAMIWARAAQSILPPFEKATGMVLAAGIKLMVRARPVFKAQFGFSLEIDAIDPAYTLGDLAARKREIRERLRREGLFDRNRQLPAPWDYRQVVVVAPAEAAGLGDFAEEARRLARHGLCLFAYAHSRFQGPEAAAEILAAAQAIVSKPAHRKADALIFIRGGGAVNDLAWLDDYALARFICECPLPVLTGIGHERDSTILDEVAQRSFDTPSKVVLGIEQRIMQRASEARDFMADIATRASDAIVVARQNAERRLAGVREAAGLAIVRSRRTSERAIGQIQLGALGESERVRGRMRSAIDSIAHGARQQVGEARRVVPERLDRVLSEASSARRDAGRRVGQALQTVTLEARRGVGEARRSTEALMREIAGQGPGKTLGRGFALVRGPDGRPLTSAAGSAAAGHLDIEFQDGRIAADVRPAGSTPNPTSDESEAGSPASPTARSRR